MAPKLKVGDRVPFDCVETVLDETILLANPVATPPAATLLHVQLRRFSGCPVCNFHLRQFAARAAELRSKCHLQSVVVFHSTKEVIVENQGSAEWAAMLDFVADPTRALYKLCGAEKSGWKYLFRLRWKTLVLGMRGMRGLLATRHWGAEAGITQQPMDMLVDVKSGCILDLKYGTDPADSWSVQEVLDKAAKASEVSPPTQSQQP